MPSLEFDAPPEEWVAQPLVAYVRAWGDGSGNLVTTMRITGSRGDYRWTEFRGPERKNMGVSSYRDNPERPPFATVEEAAKDAEAAAKGIVEEAGKGGEV